MLKTVFSALAVTAVLATGAAFAADQTVGAPAAAVTQPTATPAVAASTDGKAVTHVKHAKHAKAAPEAASSVTPVTPAKTN